MNCFPSSTNSTVRIQMNDLVRICCYNPAHLFNLCSFLFFLSLCRGLSAALGVNSWEWLKAVNETLCIFFTSSASAVLGAGTIQNASTSFCNLQLWFRNATLWLAGLTALTECTPIFCVEPYGKAFFLTFDAIKLPLFCKRRRQQSLRAPHISTHLFFYCTWDFDLLLFLVTGNKKQPLVRASRI